MKTKKVPPIHPGEILLHDFMEPLGLSQSALAKALGVTAMRVSQIANDLSFPALTFILRGHGLAAKFI
jgi:addiction module HigA family antidote